MTDEKVCPIMSGQVVIPLFSTQAAPSLYSPSSALCSLNYEMRYTKCIGNECMMWGEINDPTFNKCEQLGHPMGCRLIP